MERHIEVGHLSVIHPIINFANFSTSPAGFNWGPRVIPDCQFIHVVSGSAEITINNQSRYVLPGDTVFYGMDTPHQITVSQDQSFTFYSIHFSWDQVLADPTHPEIDFVNEEALELMGPTYSVILEGYGPVVIPHFFNLPNMESLMAPIVQEFMLADAGFAFMMRGQFHLLLMGILRGLTFNRSVASGQSKKMVDVLEAIKNQPNRSWTTKQLASMAGYHPTYFAALFKEVVGHAPKHYLILERIRLAKTLLLELDTIEAVADKLGYSSVHYFSRHFKEITGITPTEYKKRSTFL